MPPPVKPHKIGLCERSYDVISEEDSDEEEERLLHVLAWLEDPILGVGAESSKEEKGQRSRIKDNIEKELESKIFANIDAISVLGLTPHRRSIISNLGTVFTDLYDGARDILKGKRVKTSLTIFAGIGIGAAIGALLGTFFFPGIGTALGGVLGSIFASMGGTIGVTIIGAFAGSWLGKKISDKVFKHEKRFELSKRVTDKIKKEMGISSKVIQMMNGYLYNRKQMVKSPILKKYYKALRKTGIKEGEGRAFEMAARFFCHELKLLDEERKSKGSNPKLEYDIEAVVTILKKLKLAEGLSLLTHRNIAKAIKGFNRDRQGMEYEPINQMTPDKVEDINEKFVRNLNVPGSSVKKVEVEDRITRQGTLSYRYHITTKDGEILPQVIFREKKLRDNRYQQEVYVKKENLPEEKQDIVSEVLAEQAKAAGNKEIIVVACGDDNVAVSLMAAALKKGLKPRLDNAEYPEDNPEAMVRQEEIIKKARVLAGLEPTPFKKPSARL